jgi:hypothetical protein
VNLFILATHGCAAFYPNQFSLSIAFNSFYLQHAKQRPCATYNSPYAPPFAQFAFRFTTSTTRFPVCGAVRTSNPIFASIPAICCSFFRNASGFSAIYLLWFAIFAIIIAILENVKRDFAFFEI